MATSVQAAQHRLVDRGRLLVSCHDRPGLIAAVSRFLAEHGAKVVDSDQHSTGSRTNLFFMRVEFDLPDLEARLTDLQTKFASVAALFAMEWRMALAKYPKRLAIFVSREEHCLLELLWQQRAGDLYAEVAVVVSNHEDLRGMVEALGVPFECVLVTPDAKAEAEARQQAILKGRADVVVLARYMQILSHDFISEWPNRIINIHHSFLPAFVGAKPYDQAYRRGVKLIGATAHYVTEELDAGPIIEQDVARVDHRQGVDDLRRMGRHIERIVLARAVAWHAEDRILVHGNKTVVFA